MGKRMSAFMAAACFGCLAYLMFADPSYPAWQSYFVAGAAVLWLLIWLVDAWIKVWINWRGWR
jgi:hypothetical protein